jgi:NAD(P)-dependent dehydrogenase (short-subunit alcohol dehydrogenase family)
MRLKHKTALITGAARGIGRASALKFASEGARLVLMDLHEAELADLVLEIAERGGAAVAAPGDVSKRADQESAIDLCRSTYGSVDILFCNAGITLPKLMTESSDEDIDRLMSVNVVSLMQAARYTLPIMQAQGGGVMLFTASKTGLVAQVDSPVYCATKGAVVLLAKALALDYARQNIRVNALCPGIIDTPMLQHFADNTPDPAASMAAYSAAQPIGRLGTPEECADAALWLVSDESSFVTGVALPVDGGFTAA